MALDIEPKRKQAGHNRQQVSINKIEKQRQKDYGTYHKS